MLAGVDEWSRSAAYRDTAISRTLTVGSRKPNTAGNTDASGTGFAVRDSERFHRSELLLNHMDDLDVIDSPIGVRPGNIAVGVQASFS